MKTSNNSIEQLLARHGAGLTSDLAAKLQADGLSPEAARKRLSRIPKNIRVLYGLPFPKRARFIYLEHQYGTKAYWDALISALEKSNKSYAAALAGIHARGGIVPISHFNIVSGAPVKQKGHVASSTILERLVSIDLVEREVIEPFGECVRLAGVLADDTKTPLRVRLMVESILIDAVKPWAVKMNFSSTNGIETRNETIPQYSNFCFDICGPSYFWPLRRYVGKQMRHGFVVGDVIVGKTLTEAHVAPFLKKCTTLSHLRKLRPFMPMLIADGFTPEALRLCRSAGVMATTPSALFGQDAARALKDLVEALSNAAIVAASDPERIETLFTQLSKIEGVDTNLRGALFEMIVGHMVRAIEGGSIDLGVPVTDKSNGKRAEIDVRLVRENELTIYECKGSMPTTLISAADVEDWLTRCVATIYAASRAEERFVSSSISFELWTCGGFHPDALKALEKAKSNTKKYGISWREGPAVKAYAQGLKAPGIRKLLDEHYFSHPLVKIEKQKAHKRQSRDLHQAATADFSAITKSPPAQPTLE